MDVILIKIIEAFLHYIFGVPTIEEAKRDKCIALYRTGIRMWNAMTERAFSFAGMAPSSVDGASSVLVTGLGNILQAVAISILATAFLYRFFKTFNEDRQGLDVYQVIKVVLILYIGDYAVMNAGEILNRIFGIGSSLGGFIAASSNGLGESAAVLDALNAGEPGLPTMFVMLVFCIIMIVTGAGVLITVIQRLIRLFLLLPFAGSTLATIVAGGRVADVGYSFIRAALGYALEGALIVLVIIIGNNLAAADVLYSAFDGVIVDTDSMTFWRVIVGLLCQMLICGAVSGLVKQADSLVHRMFGL